MVEGRPTICVLVGNEPMARSAAGLTLKLDMDDAPARTRARIVRARTHGREDRTVSFCTAEPVHD